MDLRWPLSANCWYSLTAQTGSFLNPPVPFSKLLAKFEEAVIIEFCKPPANSINNSLSIPQCKSEEGNKNVDMHGANFCTERNATTISGREEVTSWWLPLLLLTFAVEEATTQVRLFWKIVLPVASHCVYVREGKVSLRKERNSTDESISDTKATVVDFVAHIERAI